MIAAYAIDRIGLTIAPLAVLVAALAAASAVFVGLRPSPHADRAETLALGAIAASVLAYLLWLARPSLLPVGSGPDLTHHLVLVDYIERHWRLVHDPALGAVMGEMADYTPGVHLLAALAGAWARTDGVHAMYSIVAVSVALKAAIVFAVAMRVLPRSLPRLPLAIAAIAMLFAPREYFLRSFTEHSFLAQVVSELFAVAMWWALVVWDAQPSIAASAVFAIAGAGAFLTWPVWIGPLLLTLAAIVALRRDVPVRDRLAALVTGGGPIALVAAVHAIGRTHAAGIAATSGFVVWPSLEMFGAWFVVLAAIGVVMSITIVPSRPAVWMIATIALQSAALFVVASRSGADRPYLALKMMYLAIYPLALVAAMTLAAAVMAAGRAFQTGQVGGSEGTVLPAALAWVVVCAVAVVVGRGLMREPRPVRVVSDPMYLAGKWARANLPPACVDYLVQDDDSAYWLHLAVLGNARQTDRTNDPATFDPKAALIRWIQPAGLPFAITGDFEALPKDIRTSVGVVQRFGPAAVLKRRGDAICTDSNR